MSRSKRKAPMFPPARVGSERADKKAWHGRYRALLKKRTLACGGGEGDSADAWCSEREVSNVWRMKKDGKVWLNKLIEGDQWLILGK
jgi:hypothetical protein